MIIVAAAVIVVAAYLVTGFRFVAPAWVTRQVARNISSYPELARDPQYVEEWRRDFAGLGIGVALIWPAFLMMRFLAGGIAARSPLTSHEAAQKASAQDARIADLERQLGIRP